MAWKLYKKYKKFRSKVKKVDNGGTIAQAEAFTSKNTSSPRIIGDSDADKDDLQYFQNMFARMSGDFTEADGVGALNDLANIDRSVGEDSSLSSSTTPSTSSLYSACSPAQTTLISCSTVISPDEEVDITDMFSLLLKPLGSQNAIYSALPPVAATQIIISLSIASPVIISTINETDVADNEDSEQSVLKPACVEREGFSIVQSSSFIHVQAFITDPEREAVSSMAELLPAASSAPVLASALKIRDFRIKDVLGSGAFGTILLSQDWNTCLEYAIKVVPVRKAWTMYDKEFLFEEQKALQKLAETNSPFFLNLKASFHDTKSYYLVTDFIAGGDLAGRLKLINQDFSVQDVRLFMADLVHALKLLHALRMLHRDIKPENIFIDANGRPVIGDLGMVRHFGGDDDDNEDQVTGPSASFLADSITPDLPEGDFTETGVGTGGYQAPEILLEQPYSYAVDVWALGVVMYQMIYGERPFQGQTRWELNQAVLNEVLTFPEIGKSVDDATKSLLHGMLAKLPGDRYTLEMISKHAYFASIDWQVVASRAHQDPAMMDSSDPIEMTELELDSIIDVGHPFTVDDPDPDPEFNFVSPTFKRPAPAHANDDSAQDSSLAVSSDPKMEIVTVPELDATVEVLHTSTDLEQIASRVDDVIDAVSSDPKMAFVIVPAAVKIPHLSSPTAPNIDDTGDAVSSDPKMADVTVPEAAVEVQHFSIEPERQAMTPYLHPMAQIPSHPAEQTTLKFKIHSTVKAIFSGRMMTSFRKIMTVTGLSTLSKAEVGLVDAVSSHNVNRLGSTCGHQSATLDSRIPITPLRNVAQMAARLHSPALSECTSIADSPYPQTPHFSATNDHLASPVRGQWLRCIRLPHGDNVFQSIDGVLAAAGCKHISVPDWLAVKRGAGYFPDETILTGPPDNILDRY